MKSMEETMLPRSDEMTKLDTSRMGLHELARAYSDGLLDFEQYRCARTQLLDRVTGEATVMVRQPTRPVKHAFHMAISGGGASLRSLNGRLMCWLSAILFVAITFVIWLLMD